VARVEPALNHDTLQEGVMVVRVISWAAVVLVAASASATETRLFDFDIGLVGDFEIIEPNGWVVDTIPRVFIEGTEPGMGGIVSTFYLDGNFDLSVETPHIRLGNDWVGVSVSTADMSLTARKSRVIGTSQSRLEVLLNGEVIDWEPGTNHIRGTESMRIARNGTTIAGSLTGIDPGEGYTFGAETTFSSAPVRVELWAGVNEGTAGDVEVAYDNLSITADTFFEQQPLVGDTFPLNGSVSLDDLNAVRNHFGAGELFGPPIVGDTYPFDGVVDISDLNRVRNNFGVSLPTATAIPEPATAAMLLVGLTIAIMRAGRRVGRQGTDL
jgi:hypothetical protein